MKKFIIFLTVLLLACNLHAQEDTIRYFKYPSTYGVQYPRIWAPIVLRTPYRDTSAINALPGALQSGLDANPYWWNGTRWVGLGTSADLTAYIKYSDSLSKYVTPTQLFSYTWQNSLDAPNGNILTTDNYIDVQGHDFFIQNFGSTGEFNVNNTTYDGHYIGVTIDDNIFQSVRTFGTNGLGEYVLDNTGFYALNSARTENHGIVNDTNGVYLDPDDLQSSFTKRGLKKVYLGAEHSSDVPDSMAGYDLIDKNKIVKNPFKMPWSRITLTPTTLSGYGITDASPLTIDVFPIWGQSLANPDYVFTSADSALPVLDSGIAYLWVSGGSIIPVTNNLMGPWRAFALEYYKMTGHSILFVQCAKGGSSMDSAAQYLTGTWDIRPGSHGTLYDSAVAMVDSALVTAQQYGYKTKLVGILWIQGEQDAVWMGTLTTPTAYYNALSYMVQNGLHVKYANVPFYMWRTGTRIGAPDATHSALVRQQQEAFAKADTLTKIVFRGGYQFSYANGLLRDSIHYSAAGNKYAGYAGATSVVNGWSKNTWNPYYSPVDDTTGLPIYAVGNDTLKFTWQYNSNGLLEGKKSNNAFKTFTFDPQSGGITMTNASGNASSTTLQQEAYSTTTSSASIHNLDRFGGTKLAPAQLATGATVSQINSRAPNASLTATNVATMTTTIGANTISSGAPVGVWALQTVGLSGTAANRLQIDQTGKPILGTGAIRGGGYTTGGASWQIGGSTVTDTSSTGTVTEVDLGIITANLFAASSPTTVTDLVNARVTGPTTSTNVTATRSWGIKFSTPIWTPASTSNAPSIYIQNSSTTPSTNKLSGYLSNVNNSLSFYDGTSDRTITTNDATQPLTNKTIAAGSNTITGLTNSNLSGSAAITNANLATMANNTIKGNVSGSAAVPSDLTVEQLSIPKVVATGLLSGQTTTQNVITYTVGAADSSFEIAPWVIVTAFTSGTLTGTITYTDITNTARTLTLFSLGTTSAALVATGVSNYPVIPIRCKASTTITYVQTVSGTLTYTAGGKIVKNP